MKINFTDYDLTGFDAKNGMFAGIPCYLITPNHIGTKFTQKNKIFRSSVWTRVGQLLSGGLKKFVNLGENPIEFPSPLTTNKCTIIEKVDGSLVCIDYVNDQVSMRTRGTFSYTSLDNFADFDYCLEKYPFIVTWLQTNPQYTLLCEITTPNLRIIVDYGTEPEFWLIGAINKDDYSLMPQHELDELGKYLQLKRPSKFSFSTMAEMLLGVEAWEDKEGVCLYSGNDQEIHKIKAAHYLKCHRFKSEATLENTLELYFSLGRPSYQDFQTKLIETFDYECFEMVRGYASDICDAAKKVKEIIDGIDNFVVETLSKLPTRKDQALKIMASYGDSSRSGFVFTRLDNKPLTDDQIKKIFWQALKK